MEWTLVERIRKPFNRRIAQRVFNYACNYGTNEAKTHYRRLGVSEKTIREGIRRLMALVNQDTPYENKPFYSGR